MAHVAVGLAAGRWYARGAEPASVRGAMLGFTALSMLPDLDVIAFRFGIPYAHPFGHRGFSHSFAFALATGLALAAVGRARGHAFGRLAALSALVVASHGLLDAFTDGGKGIALLWPFSDERIFWPWRPIPVAPIGLGILSAYGLYVLGVETVGTLPLLAYALWPRR